MCEGPTVWVAVIIDLGGWRPALGDTPYPVGTHDGASLLQQ